MASSYFFAAKKLRAVLHATVASVLLCENKNCGNKTDKKAIQIIGKGFILCIILKNVFIKVTEIKNYKQLKRNILFVLCKIIFNNLQKFLILWFDFKFWKMEVYKSDFIRIEYEGSKSLLFAEWSDKTANMPENVFLKEVNGIIDLLIKYRAKYFLVDERQFKFITRPELQTVVVGKVLSRIATSGLLKFAHVSSLDFLALISVEQTFEDDKNKTYQERFIDNIETARDWILSN